jgi:tRNA/rRNA methyltransferase
MEIRSFPLFFLSFNGLCGKALSMTQPIIILVAPQMGENIGATARAMLNCGLTQLRLVAPRDGWPNDRATALSSGAFDKMDPVEVFDTLQDAIADCQRIFATTGLSRDIVKPVHTPQHATPEIFKSIQDGNKTAILFGCERVGLNNSDMALAQDLVTIPSNPDFPSLNLAQAVMVMTYEWSKIALHYHDKILPVGKSDIATAESFNRFFDRLDNGLQDAGFYRSPEMKDTVSRNIRALFARATPTEQEINTLHGILTTLSSVRDKK